MFLLREGGAMDEIEGLLNTCKVLFDNSLQAVGVARVLVDDQGEPYDFHYAALLSKIS